MLNADCTCGCETFCYFREYITGAAAGITVAIAVNKKNEPTPKNYGVDSCPIFTLIIISKNIILFCGRCSCHSYGRCCAFFHKRLYF